MPQWHDTPPNLLCRRPLFQRKPDLITPIDLNTQIPTKSEKIHLTQYAQPAIFNLECMLFGKIQPFIRADSQNTFMGHSLGQYSAIVCSGRLALSDGFDMVLERGRIMSEVSMIDVPFSMVAVILRNISMEDFIRVVKEDGGCDIANINSDKQIVLSGDKEAIQRVLDKTKCKGMKLNVSAPFHSRYMKWASTNFYKYLLDTFDEVGLEPGMADTIQGFGDHNEYQIASERPCEDIICNMTAKPFDGTLKTLADHILSPVLWHNSMEHIFSNKNKLPELIIEIGPKSTLLPLLNEKIKSSIPIAFIGKEDDINQII